MFIIGYIIIGLAFWGLFEIWDYLDRKDQENSLTK